MHCHAFSRHARLLMLLMLCGLPWSVTAKTFTVDSTDTKQASQIKLGSEWKRSANKTQWKAPSAEFATPLTRHWDIAIKGFYHGVNPKHGDTQHGLGDMEIKSKLNFYRRGHLSVASKPEITLPTGNQHKGLGDGHPGYTLPVFMNYRIGRWRFGSEVGYSYLQHYHEKSGYAALLASYKVRDSLETGVGFVSASKDGKFNQLFHQAETGFKWKLPADWSLQALFTYTLNAPAKAHRDHPLKIKIEKVFR